MAMHSGMFNQIQFMSGTVPVRDVNGVEGAWAQPVSYPAALGRARSSRRSRHQYTTTRTAKIHHCEV